MPRREDRLPYLKEVELEFASGRRSARISDISTGGCYIDTIAQAPIGEKIKLHISGPDGDSMEFDGKVAYLLEGFGFGVEFLDVDDARRDFLNKLIKASAG